MINIPPKQNPHETAFYQAIEKLKKAEIKDPRLEELGVKRVEERFFLPLLGQMLVVDQGKSLVEFEELGLAKRSIAILSLHYILSHGSLKSSKWVSFADFSDGRNYYPVFRNRLIKRFLMTSGKNENSFCQAANRLCGSEIKGFPWPIEPNGSVANDSRAFDLPKSQNLNTLSDSMVAWSLKVLPKLPITIVRYRSDEEFPADANFLFPADANNILVTEDLVVAAEFLLDCLDGKPLWMNP